MKVFSILFSFCVFLFISLSAEEGGFDRFIPGQQKYRSEVIRLSLLKTFIGEISDLQIKEIKIPHFDVDDHFIGYDTEQILHITIKNEKGEKYKYSMESPEESFLQTVDINSLVTVYIYRINSFSKIAYIVVSKEEGSVEWWDADLGHIV